MLNDLKKLVIAQKTAALPSEAPAPEFEALHQALNAYDQLVSQVVIQAIQDIPFDYPQEQAHHFRDEVERLLNEHDSRREIDLYRRYKQRLDRMSDMVEKYSSPTTHQESS